MKDFSAIDRICDDFESKCAQGEMPQIEALLDSIDVDSREYLLQELLLLELEFRAESGVQPRREEYARRFGEQRDLVDSVFVQFEEKRATLHRNVDDTHPPSVAATQESTRSHSAENRFDIVEEHAAGGLGKVYIANDNEIHRRVAVKKLHLSHARNAESRERFLREAEITGGLEHPGIVPIYSAGKDDAGAPFYAMRFVSGETLHQAIEAFHGENASDQNQQSIEMQKLLRRFLDVCNTVGYAHSNGVIHRDIKPANIILGKFGETQIVDWGMAKRVGDSENRRIDEGTSAAAENDPPTSSNQETRQGSVMGTPSYMSPEQAAGQIEKVTFASDLYSLGATLYHLIVGEAPMQNQPALDIVERVKKGDVPRPRSIQPRAPRPLEAICLKAMQFQPEDRYSSTAELSADLERFLANEPISVFRDPLTTRISRWAGKHRTMVVGIIVATVVLLVSSLTALFIVNGAKDREKFAKQTAQEKNELAKYYFRKARIAVDDYLGKVQSESRLRNEGLTDLRAELLLSAKVFYEDLAKQNPDDPDLQLDVAVAMQKLAAIHRELGNVDDALASLQDARNYLIGILDDDPDNLQATNELAKTLADLAFVHRVQGKIDKAKKLFAEAIDTFEKLSSIEADNQEYQEAQMECLSELGNLHYAVQDYDGALELLNEAIQRADSADWNSNKLLTIKLGAVQHRASTYAELNQTEKKKADFKEAFRIALAMHENAPEEIAFAINLVSVYSNYVQEFRDPDDIKPIAMVAIEKFEPMLIKHRNNITLQSSMSVIYRQMGESYAQNTKHAVEAVRWFRKSIEILKPIVERNPKLFEWSKALAYTQYRFGALLQKMSQHDEMETNLTEAIKRYQTLDKKRLDIKHPLAVSCYMLAVSHHNRNEVKKVIPLAKIALPIFKELIAELPDNPNIGPQQLSCYEVLYLAYWNSRQKEPAIESLKEAIEIAEARTETLKGPALKDLQRTLQTMKGDLKLFTK